MDNNPFLRTWHLEMSILVAPFDREANPTKNVVNMLHCFAPHPLRVAPIANGDVAGSHQCGCLASAKTPTGSWL
jgi:hypothetical protein